MSLRELELTWIGKENRPRLEPRILLEEPQRSYHAPLRVTDAGVATVAAALHYTNGSAIRAGRQQPQGPTRHSTMPADWRGRSCASMRSAVVTTGRKPTRLNWSRAMPYSAVSEAGCHPTPSQ
jgi:hypothetical protein